MFGRSSTITRELLSLPSPRMMNLSLQESPTPDGFTGPMMRSRSRM